MTSDEAIALAQRHDALARWWRERARELYRAEIEMAVAVGAATAQETERSK